MNTHDEVEKLKVEAVILDLDGTIVNSRTAYVEAAKTAFRELGLDPPTKQAMLEIPKRLEQNLSISELVNTDVSRFLKVYLESFYSLTATKSKPFPNVESALKNLQQKAKLAIVTMRNYPRTKIAGELQRFGLTKYFDFILTAKDTRKPKPSPEALENALEKMAIRARDCLVVGDSVIDIAAGKSIGAKTAAVLSGLYTENELGKLNPDLILNDVTQLLEYID